MNLIILQNAQFCDTSFNARGEPIVCSIEDAFNCFMGTNLDILVIENFIMFKDDQKNN